MNICPSSSALTPSERAWGLVHVGYFWPLTKENTDPDKKKEELRIMQKPKGIQRGNPRGSPNCIKSKLKSQRMT